jgi:cation:H+ antiporter
VLGLTAAISPNAIDVPDGALSLDLPVMIAVAIACLPMFANGYALLRWEGALVLAFYGAYLGWLVIEAADHPIREGYAVGIVGFMLPLSVITLVVIAVRERRSTRSLAG